MPGYPPFGTRPIKCCRRGCSFRGYETDLAEEPCVIGGVVAMQSVCPVCGNQSYQFMKSPLSRRERGRGEGKC